MRPLAAVTLIVLGSAFAITASLGAVILIIVLLGSDDPRVTGEYSGLVRSFFIFLGMTAVAAVSFYTSLRMHDTRFWAQGVLWLSVLATGWHYWP